MKSPDSDSRPNPVRVEQLFHAASVLPADERPPFLRQECGTDRRLLESVESLLAAADASSTAWDESALEWEARHSALDSRQASAGEFFGPYRILRRVAAGGMSLVYEAVRDDAEFQKRVAIKFVHGGIDDTGLGERFRSERQILAQLEHPYIARLLDGGTTPEGVPYLVMEYVEGVPIDHFVTGHHLPPTERLHLFLQVCEAVQYAHRNLVVHRDLKPANILVTSGGMVKLLDFGIAKLITNEAPGGQPTTVRALTPEYASPEQITGRSINTSTDVYSLGVLLFVLLADRLPYASGAVHPAELLRAICAEPPSWQPPGLIDSELQSVLAQALRKEPERRYLSVEQFAADIRCYLAGLPLAARPDTLFYRARKFALRRALPLAAAGALTVAVLVGLTTSLWQARRAEQQRLLAVQRFDDVRTLAHSLMFDVYNAMGSAPGTLAARQLVVSRAQEYLDRLVRETAGDSGLALDIGLSYLRLGDVRGGPYAANLGDTAGALESYRKAQALLEAEVLRRPGAPDVQEAVACAHIAVGRALIRKVNAEDAVAILQRAVAEAETLGQRHPGDRHHIEMLSQAYICLGEAYCIAAAKADSLAGYRQEFAMYQKSLKVLEAPGHPSDPAWQSAIAKGHFSVAYALWALGDATADLSYYQQALVGGLQGEAIHRAIAAADPEWANRREFADGRATVGLSRWKCCRDGAGALHDLEDALSRFQRIADAEPQNLEARRDLSNVYQAMATILAGTGQRRRALETGGKALRILEEVDHADPGIEENTAILERARAQMLALERRP